MGVENEGRRKSRSLRLPSPAMCVALLALFVGMTSGAYATAKFKHGPKGIVNAQDIAFNTITGAEVKNHSLLQADLSGSALRNLRGAKGATGPAGPQGTAGVNGQPGAQGPPGVVKLWYRYGTAVTQPAFTQNFGSASCDSGTYAVGGGVFSTGEYNQQHVNGSYPQPATNTSAVATSWGAYVDNVSGDATLQFQVYVICAQAGAVVGKTAGVKLAQSGLK